MIDQIPYPACFVFSDGRILHSNSKFKLLLNSLSLNTSDDQVLNVFDPKQREDIEQTLHSKVQREPVTLSNLRLYDQNKNKLDRRLWSVSIGHSLVSESLIIFEETTALQSLVRTADDLFQSLPDSFLLVNRLGVLEQSYVVDSTLLKQDPVPGMLIWDLFDEDLHSNISVLMQQCRLSQEEQSEELLIDKDGKKKWCDIHVHPSVSSLLIVLKDVTKKNRLMERMVEEERLSSVGILAGGIAHQYNNIHHAVLGFLETSLSMSGVERDEIVKKAIRKLRMSTHLTSSLLDFSRGHTERGANSFSLKDSFQQVEALTQKEFLKHGCKLHIPKTDMAIHVNRVVFEQILINLLVNAAHACITSPKKEVSLEVSCTGETCHILVKDTGAGISESHQRRIFTPFFSTKGDFAKTNSPHAKIRGNGLGLALSRRLARQFRGDLVLCESSKRGTVFELSFPKGDMEETWEFKERDSHIHSNAMNSDLKSEKLNFVILDDLPENRQVLHFYLKAHAERILEYESGDVAIEDLEAFNPDVIFVDWLMPRVNGNEFLSRLKESKHFDFLRRAFILSGFHNSEEIELWRPLIGGVIEKPISRDKLFKEVLARQGQASVVGDVEFKTNA